MSMRFLYFVFIFWCVQLTSASRVTHNIEVTQLYLTDFSRKYINCAIFTGNVYFVVNSLPTYISFLAGPLCIQNKQNNNSIIFNEM